MTFLHQIRHFIFFFRTRLHQETTDLSETEISLDDSLPKNLEGSPHPHVTLVFYGFCLCFSSFSFLAVVIVEFL